MVKYALNVPDMVLNVTILVATLETSLQVNCDRQTDRQTDRPLIGASASKKVSKNGRMAAVVRASPKLTEYR